MNLPIVAVTERAFRAGWLRCSLALLAVSSVTAQASGGREFPVFFDSVTGRLIPARFFIENKLPLLTKDPPLQDPDGDGFLNEDEWRHGTNPQDQHSHPPFYTKLFFVDRSGAPVSLRLMAYDLADQTRRPKAGTFQVNVRTADREQSAFVKLGDTIKGTNLRVTKFTPKRSAAANAGQAVDLSELTVTNGLQEVVLVLGRLERAPDGEVVLRDHFAPVSQVTATVTRDFELKAEPGVRYRLLGLTKDGAVIVLPDGKRYVAPPVPEAVAGK